MAESVAVSDNKITEEFIESLPQVTFAGLLPMYRYEGFWYTSEMLKNVIYCQKHFQANNGDIIIASEPKTGTTWLKALVFAVLNRSVHRPNSQNHPLLHTSPHQLVPFFELSLYDGNPCPDLTKFETNPRLFATHIPYSSLPESIKSNSDVKVVYIGRNPFDTAVSVFEFICSAFQKPFEKDKVFDSYCEGVHLFGPFYDHVLQYWNKSLEKPQNVLFLKYEDLKDDVVFHLKRLAVFLGRPSTPEEKNAGVVQEISHLCSFKTLKDLGVNKTGQFETPYVKFGKTKGLMAQRYHLALFTMFTRAHVFDLQHFYRNGEVGGWRDHFTPEMTERFFKLNEKLANSGLSFNISS